MLEAKDDTCLSGFLLLIGRPPIFGIVFWSVPRTKHRTLHCLSAHAKLRTSAKHPPVSKTPGQKPHSYLGLGEYQQGIPIGNYIDHY